MKKIIIMLSISLLTIFTYLIFASDNEKENTQKYKFSKNELLGNIDPRQHENFIRLNPSDQVVPGRTMYLRKEAYRAFKNMAIAAKKDGIELKIISPLRTFNAQKRIWERKYNGKYKKLYPDPYQRCKGILMYSSMPGTSRHHWGTDIDLNSLDNHYFEKHSYGKKVYQWLKANASRYGFCMPYSAKIINGGNRKFGYEMEKWHWSYYPLAKTMLHEYNQQIRYSDIKDFNGSSYAEKIQVIKYYVNGIYQGCK